MRLQLNVQAFQSAIEIKFYSKKIVSLIAQCGSADIQMESDRVVNFDFVGVTVETALQHYRYGKWSMVHGEIPIMVFS